ncbi:MAG: Probable two-component response regulator [uncultured Sulfurovum sp.]|uniref:Probable two-component response regulator n=1 Tax=uncultured Sulfurovum sp. TaxID=269237 RepID=A0A6S6TIJ3_9BACT|nr:MAG: Probable two-component response regulator [uncultured Sulfurovum sp.]
METLKVFEETRILSVDDDDFNQAMATAIFDDYPQIHMLQASQGKEALEVLDKEPIDLILLDLIMPEMDGFETLKRIKDSPEYRDIPVIVVTSKDEEKRKTYQLGANDFISKPYSPEELKLRVYNHLKIKKFSELLYGIKDDVSAGETSSNSHLLHLQEAVKIAINSQKKLLSKLGALSHEDNEKNEKSIKRMGEYVKLMAKLCGLNTKEIDNLYYVMSIYDIGLLRIPKEDRTDITSKVFKSYPKLGVSVLEDLEETTLIKMAKEVMLTHQENWDGSGYPQALKGDEIPFYARIVSLVNFYDELTMGRPYSEETHSANDTLEIMKREKGVKFDPQLLTLFVENFEQFRELKNQWT